MSDAVSDDAGASRRSMLKTGALGVGALATAIGVVSAGASSADAATLLPAVPTAPNNALDNFYLKIADVPGDSRVRGHEGELQVLTFAWGVSNSGSFSSGGGGGAGKAQVTPFQFTARSSVASPKLFLAAVTGEHLSGAQLSVERRGVNRQFIKIVLSEVLVSSYEIADDPAGGAPLDVVTLAWAKISYSFTPQTTSGALGTPVIGGWDVTKNKKI
jgi:type VI secretion system secreted protein Hcp